MNEGLFIAIGYLIFTIYTCGIMYLGILLEQKTNIDKTMCRKFTHIISAFVWIICYFFFGCSLHWVILNAVGAVALGFITLNKRFTAFQRDDAKNSPGMFYFGLSTAIVALICYLVGEELYYYAGVAYFVLALGDGFAPIIARLFGKYNLQIQKSKTLVGTITVLVVSFFTTLVFSKIFNMNLSLLFILSVASLATVIEFYGFKGTDNIFIEFFVFGYLVLYHYGLVTLPLQIVLIASPILAILAISTHSMTLDGGFSAFFLFAFIGFFGENYTPIIFISLLFFISIVVSFIGKKIEKARGERKKEYKARRAKQIIAVGLFATIALICYRITNKEIFYHLFFLALIEQIADSMASDIGRLTKGKNLSIITWRTVEKGISGGVSALGTCSALISSLLLACIPLLFSEITFTVALLIAFIAFLGTILDSVFGALFQSLYVCDICSVQIESHTHCGKRARLIKGIKAIDNVAVNYIAGFATCALGILLIFV